jgi:hypothetical protein
MLRTKLRFDGAPQAFLLHSPTGREQAMLQDLKKGLLKNGGKSRGQDGVKERRAEPRYNIAAMAEAIEIKSNTRLSGRISDFGVGGCYFEVMSPFGVGSDVQLRITRNEQTLTANGRVLYSTGGMGMGLVFTRVEPEQRSLLLKWVSELSGKQMPTTSQPETNSETSQSPPASPAFAYTHEVEHQAASAAEASGSHDEQRNVLNELIISLMRKRVLTDSEGKELLRKLMS